MKKILFVLSLVSMSYVTSFGQQDGWKAADVPIRMDWFIGASGGTTYSFADNSASGNFRKNFPCGDFQVGTFLTKYFGLRVGGSIGIQTGQPDDATIKLYPEYDAFYRFYVMNAYADGLFNLSPLFAPKRRHRQTFDVMLFAGPGIIEAIHFDMKLRDWDQYPVDYHDKTCWSFHTGVMTAYRFSSHWDWTLEVSYNLTESRYDGVEEDASVSGFMKFHTGLVYHIYDRNDKRRVRLTTDTYSDLAPRYTEDDREKVIKEERKRIEKARKEASKQRATKNEKIKKHNEEVKKANEQFRKDKKKRAKKWEEGRKYNELIY